MRGRLALLFGTLIAIGASVVLLPKAQKPKPVTARVMDRRCRGGCTDSALLRLFQYGPSTAQIANPGGGLQTPKGQAVTTTRASAKYCQKTTAWDTAQLFQSPEDLTGSGWSASGSAAATANFDYAPDGTKSASRLVVPSTSGGSFNYRSQTSVSLSAATSYTFSVYLKGASAAGSVYLTLTPDAVSYVRTLCAYDSAAWSRCSVSFTATAGNWFVGIGRDGRDGSQAAIGAQDLLVWGTKLEQAASATTYVSPQLVSLGNNIPCVESAGLLVEGASTNLALQSQAFDDAAWTKTTATVTANAALAPDGTLTADSVAISATNGGVASTGVTAAAVVYTGSVYAWVASSTTSGVRFKIRDTTGAADLVTTSPTLTTTPQKVTFTIPSAATATNVLKLIVESTSNAQTPILWQAQLEASPFATSPVATAGTTASRTADLVSVANPLPNGSGPWGVWMTITPESGAAWGSGGTRAWGLNGFTGANSANGQIDASNVYNFIYDSTPTQGFGFAPGYTFVAGSTHRIGWTLNGSTVGIYQDGVSQSITNGGAGTRVMSAQGGNFNIGSVSSGAQIGGYVKDIAIFSSASGPY